MNDRDWALRQFKDGPVYSPTRWDDPELARQDIREAMLTPLKRPAHEQMRPIVSRQTAERWIAMADETGPEQGELMRRYLGADFMIVGEVIEVDPHWRSQYFGEWAPPSAPPIPRGCAL